MKTSTTKKGICQICKRDMGLNLLMPGFSVRNSLVKLITDDHIEWNPKGYICLDDLNRYRGKYVQNILEEEKGELSGFDKEVLESIIERDLISKNLSENEAQKITAGQKLSDKLAQFGGSWTFISIFATFLFIWMTINIVVLTVHPFDPYPFILLNLILSCLAAIQAPIIMMSQNRQEAKDRTRAQHDYQINLKSEIEIRQLNDKIDHLMIQQGQKMLEIQQIQVELIEDISKIIKKN